jgi:hypothetical protein
MRFEPGGSPAALDEVEERRAVVEIDAGQGAAAFPANGDLDVASRGAPVRPGEHEAKPALDERRERLAPTSGLPLRPVEQGTVEPDRGPHMSRHIIGALGASTRPRATFLPIPDRVVATQRYEQGFAGVEAAVVEPASGGDRFV